MPEILLSRVEGPGRRPHSNPLSVAGRCARRLLPRQCCAKHIKQALGRPQYLRKLLRITSLIMADQRTPDARSLPALRAPWNRHRRCRLRRLHLETRIYMARLGEAGGAPCCGHIPRTGSLTTGDFGTTLRTTDTGTFPYDTLVPWGRLGTLQRVGAA